jgi:glycerate-2-kinase
MFIWALGDAFIAGQNLTRVNDFRAMFITAAD